MESAAWECVLMLCLHSKQPYFYKVYWILWLLATVGGHEMGPEPLTLLVPTLALTLLSAASENTAGWRQMPVPSEWAAPYARKAMRLWISVVGLLPSL